MNTLKPLPTTTMPLTRSASGFVVCNSVLYGLLRALWVDPPKSTMSLEHCRKGEIFGRRYFPGNFSFLRKGAKFSPPEIKTRWQCGMRVSCNDVQGIVLKVAGGPLVADVDVLFFYFTFSQPNSQAQHDDQVSVLFFFLACIVHVRCACGSLSFEICRVAKSSPPETCPGEISPVQKSPPPVCPSTL